MKTTFDLACFNQSPATRLQTCLYCKYLPWPFELKEEQTKKTQKVIDRQEKT